jgi:ferrous iron transport protein A
VETKKSMNVHWRRPLQADPVLPQALPQGVRRLADVRRGARGEVMAVSPDCMTGAAPAEREELERRLLEIGFVEGARIEVLHEGFIGRDPIAVKLDDMRVALRRREAQGVLVRLDE